MAWHEPARDKMGERGENWLEMEMTTTNKPHPWLVLPREQLEIGDQGLKNQGSRR